MPALSCFCARVVMRPALGGMRHHARPVNAGKPRNLERLGVHLDNAAGH